ncbi:MucBP domain-containing protein [Lactococcus allomyrinae]|uniref:Gram-positive cocci surface proteins LPxTG domain-containing protein n=1 Tax=Lactococcus allomyrinae TaxID=2419773 RepID=A0A387BEB2_9LACT|nr:MucBP domain-containing protein [Lactococcus allomyrinae]AYG00594.1 hypothetical protein D7I46_05495 [Lactococcus allomyrinae]
MSILGASLSVISGGTEYITTADAKGAILSNDSNYPARIGAENVDGSSLGLPSGLNIIFGVPSGSSNLPSANDSDSNSFAKTYGVSFANFTTSTPTFYFGTIVYATGEGSDKTNHLMMSSALAYNPPILTVVVPTVVAPVIATPASPTPLSANYNVTELDIIATPPAITAPITSTAVINKPIDLTQGGQVTGEDNGELIAYPANDMVVTITDSSGNTTTLPEGTTDYTPTTSGNYTVTYTYTSANGTASTTTIFSIPDTVTTNYVDSSGSILASSNVQTVEVGNSYNTSATVVEGYILTTIPSNASGTISSGDGPVQVTYVYSPLGSYVVTNPDGSTDETIYPNDPSNPTQPGSPTNVIPYVPGYTPEGPDGTALTPVDPNDPSQGYLPPAIPDDPTQDTPITYTQDQSSVTANYVDGNGNEVAPSAHQTGGVGDAYTTTAPVVDGYVLTDTPSNASGTLSEDETQVTYVYSPLGSYVVTNPDGSTDETIYPNDPSNPAQPGSPTNVIPYVPGYTPEGPDGTALTPVDPNDPSQGYLPPAIPDDPTQDTPITYTQDQSSVTANYVDGNGNEVAPSAHQTGGVGDAYTTTAPVVDGYVLTDTPSNASGTLSEDETQVTYVYSPLGSYVVTNPDGSTDETIYPNDPSNPAQPGSPTNVIPYVPGYTPEGPDGTALTPVDPSDPSQGYLPPAIPDDPTQDTPITYTQDQSSVTANYVDGNGNEVAPSAHQTGGVGDAYTTTAPVVDGYVLTDTPSNASGTLSEDETQVTYVYSPLGSYVVTNPDGSTDETIYPNDPSNPTQPGSPTNVIPYVPGYTPEGPDGTALTPVDPNDPSQGYLPPAIPDDPTQDTPITYTKNSTTSEGSGNTKNPKKTGESGENSAQTSDKTIGSIVDSTLGISPVSASTLTLSGNDLPKTGDDEKISKEMSGVGLVMLLGILGLANINKRKKSDD